MCEHATRTLQISNSALCLVVVLILSSFLRSNGYECVTRVYGESFDAPSSVLQSQGVCGGEKGRGGSRALATDFSRSPPELRNVGPSTEQSLTCMLNAECTVAVTGFGLHRKDQLLLLPLAGGRGSSKKEGAMCPPTSAQMKTAQRYIARDQFNATSLTVFSLPVAHNTTAPKTYFMCYSSHLAAGTDSPEVRDFWHKVGELHVGKDVMHCSFEDGFCSFSDYVDDADDTVWKMGSGNPHGDEFVVHPGTGPEGDATEGLKGKGNYVYLDSPRWLAGAVATLRSAPLFSPEGIVCLRFAYNMFGDDVNALRVYVQNFTKEAKVTGDWGNPNWLLVGNQGPGWKRAGVQVLSDGSKPLQVLFEAVTGDSELGDIAVDDVSVGVGECEADLLQPHTPQDDSMMVCGEVRLVSGEWALDKSWYVDGAVSCAGRGYSADRLNGTWMPCCLPSYGNYTVVLEDAFGDGWDGSFVEFRFFGKVLKLGEDFTGDDDNADGAQDSRSPEGRGNSTSSKRGKEKSYKIVIGLMQITDANGYEDRLEVQVQVRRNATEVWCMAVEPDSPPPTGKTIQEKGKPANVIHAEGEAPASAPLQRKEKALLTLKDENFMPNTEYDVYCYAKSSEAFAESELVTDDPSSATVVHQIFAGDATEMDDKQVAASRVRVTSDNTPPAIQLSNITADTTSASLLVKVSELSSVWCAAMPVENDGSAVYGDDEAPRDMGVTDSNKKAPPPSFDMIKEIGAAARIEANDTQPLVLRNLIPDTVYTLYCCAEDAAHPEHNKMTEEEVAATAASMSTESKIPTYTIVSSKALADTITLTTELDSPGQLWCAAREAKYPQPPTKEQVTSLGATASFSRPHQRQELYISGVESNLEYDIYCYTSSATGRSEMAQESMWTGKTRVRSFGKFCELPTTPRTVEPGLKSPFAPLTVQERGAVRSFMRRQRHLDLEGTYRVTLFPDKEAILKHLDEGGPFPKRYARVRAGRCTGTRGFYLQFKVGPLDQYDMDVEELGEPTPTTCEGWSPTGPFGRRRRLRDHTSLHDVFVESFGHGFGAACQQDEEQQSGTLTCLRAGPILHEHNDKYDGESGDFRSEDSSIDNEALTSFAFHRHVPHAWVGMKTPEDEQIPFFFRVRLPREDVAGSSTSSATLDVSQLLDIHAHLIDGVEYNGVFFNTTEDFLSAYAGAEQSERLEGKKLTPSDLLAERERRREVRESNNRHRRLQRRQGREGLEYRVGPEHVEPQGKRFVVQERAAGTCYSLAYVGWEFTITNDRDKALHVWDLKFKGVRVAFSISMEEAMAHYTVQERNWFFIDSWYGGLGRAARKLTRRFECPTTGILLFSHEHLCVYEQDFGRPLRSHWKSDKLDDAAPLHGLVMRQIITVSNYDYIYDWFFYNTGNFEAMVSFTGELYQGVEVPNYSARQNDWGTKVTASGRFGALHSHWAFWRIDFEVFGKTDDNSVLFSEVIGDPHRPGAHKVKQFFADDENGAAWKMNGTRALKYHVVTEGAKTFGEALKGYIVVPKTNTAIPWPEHEFYKGTASWTKFKIATTVYHPWEFDGSLPRDNKYTKNPAVVFQDFVNNSEPLRRKDIVTWVSSGLWHIPAVEDWPLTVAQGNSLGFMVKAFNMYEEDPSMDLHNAYGGSTKDPGSCAVVRQFAD